MKKRLLILLCAVFCAMQLSAATYSVTVDNIKYTVDTTTGEATVASQSTSLRKNNLVIPDYITYDGQEYPVTSIGNSAFNGCSGLTGSLTIPNSVTSIANNTFNGCTALSKLIIEDGENTLSLGYNYTGSSYKGLFYDCPIETLYLGRNLSYKTDQRYDYSPFYGKSTLKTLTIGNSVTEIGSSAFNGCSGLKSVSIPPSVTSIGYNAFSGCSGLIKAAYPNTLSNPFPSGSGKIISYDPNLTQIMPESGTLYAEDTKTILYVPISATTVTIPEDTKIIGECAFQNCTGLTTIDLPEGVTELGERAFSGCTGLTSVTIPTSVTEIGGYAFYGCSGLTSVTIPNSVITIGSSAFSGCSSMKSVTIPNSVTEIGSSAFSGCSSMKSVTIPNSVTEIGSSAFDGCSGLKSVHITDIAAWCNINFGNSSSNPLYYTHQLLVNGNEITELVIPESVTAIGNYAFQACNDIIKIISNAITPPTLYDDSFSPVTYESTIVTVPEGSLKSYQTEWSRFKHLMSGKPTEATFTLEKAGTLMNKINLSEVNNITSLKLSGPLNGTDLLTLNKIPNIERLDLSEATIVSGGMNYYEEDNVRYGTEDNTLGNYWAYALEVLKEVQLPRTLTTIGSDAFKNKYQLKKLGIPNSVTQIGNYAFDGCIRLTELIIEDGEQTLMLGYNGYSSNSNSTGEGLFYDCPIDTLYLGRNLSYQTDKSHGYSPFYNKSTLKTITIGNSVTEIGYRAFSGCSGLKSVHITNIAAWCNINFEDSSSNPLSYAHHLYLNDSEITELIIPDNVTAIRQFVFHGCSGLKSVTILNSVTEIGSSAFDGCSGLKSVHITDIAAWCNINFKDSSSNPLSYAHHLYLNDSEITELIIPDNVTAIRQFVFYGCSGLKSVTILNSVTEIGSSAFDGCSGLTSIHITDIAAWCNINFGNSSSNPLSYAHHLYLNDSEITELIIPDNVTAIRQFVFYGCSGLTSVTIPNSVTEIGSAAFDGCSGLNGALTIPNSVTSIGSYAFYGCSGLTSVTIPNSVTYIGSSAFEGCSGLTSANIPNSVTSIGNNAFWGCSGLTDLIIEDGNLTLSLGYNGTGKGLFSGCPIETLYLGRNLSYSESPFSGKSTLKNLTIGNSVTSIGDYAFNGCSGLTSVTLGNSVTEIGMSAFNGCSGLGSITIPNSTTSIGDYAFNGCTGLRKLIIEDGAKTLSLGVNYPGYYYRVTGKGLFYDCPIETLYLGRNLSYNTNNYYGYSPFYDITELKVITIGNSVTEIGWYAFSGCSGLTSVTLGNSVTEIGVSAFNGCSGLRSITIPNSTTSIDSEAFNGCTGLRKLIIEDGAKTLSLGFNYSGYYNRVTGKGLFYDCPIETLYLGRNLSYNTDNYYGYSPFYGQFTIKALTIGNSVTSIGNYAFAGCSGLKSVHITDITAWCNIKFENSRSNPLYYAHHLYLNDSEITELVIPDHVTAIRQFVFYGCSGLTSVTIPNSVTEISNYAFNGCTGLTELIIEDGKQTLSLDYNLFSDCPIETVYVGRNFGDGDRPLKGKSTLTTLTFGNSVTSIGESAFSGCSGLTSLVLPAMITELKESTFEDCSQLTSVTIPGGVRYIRPGAFKGCSSLESVNMINPIPAVIEEDSFDFTGTLNVPEESLMYYWIHPLWSKFPNLQAWNVGTDVDFVTEDDNATTFHITSEESATVEVTAATLLSRASGELTIPETVTFNGKTYTVAGIANNAFHDMAFEAIELPKTIAYVGLNAFSGCSALKTLTVNAQLPPSAARESFDNQVFATTTLIVPEEATEAYENHDIWKLFANKELVDIDEFTTPADDVPMEVYDMRGVKVGDSLKDLPHGVYIIRQGSKTTKIAI